MIGNHCIGCTAAGMPASFAFYNVSCNGPSNSFKPTSNLRLAIAKYKISIILWLNYTWAQKKYTLNWRKTKKVSRVKIIWPVLKMYPQWPDAKHVEVIRCCYVVNKSFRLQLEDQYPNNTIYWASNNDRTEYSKSIRTKQGKTQL